MENVNMDFMPSSRLGLCCSANAPTHAKTKWLAARITMTIGNPPRKKPMVVPNATATATRGEINMAMKMATWLAKVKEAGSRMILKGENVGITMPTAIKTAASTSS